MIWESLAILGQAFLTFTFLNANSLYMHFLESREHCWDKVSALHCTAELAQRGIPKASAQTPSYTYLHYLSQQV